MHPIGVVSVLAGSFTFYILTIFMPWMPVSRPINFISIMFVYPMVVFISLVLKLIASVGESTVHFIPGWVIMVVSGGGWVLIVVVRVKEGQVMAVVVKFRGRIVPIRIFRSAGTATVIICITMAILIDFLVVAILIVDEFPMVGL